MTSEKTPFELEPEDDEPEDDEPEAQPPDEREPTKPTEPVEPFELEPPPKDISSRSPPPGVLPPARGDVGPPESGRAAPTYVPPSLSEEVEEVDVRTVAEKLGTAAPRSTERAPKPPDWPREVLTFPGRRPGLGFIALGVGTLLLFDLAGGVYALQFPSWVAKLLLLVYVLRAQFHVIGSSAAGYDDPRGWQNALTFDREDLKQYWRTLLMFAGALAPGTLLFVFEQIGVGIVVLLIGAMYASVVALGAALKDPALKWPWNAFSWMGARPLHCLAGSVAWWVLIATELALYGLRDDGLVLIGFVSLALRIACLYLLLACARVIGVMGRRWSPR